MIEEFLEDIDNLQRVLSTGDLPDVRLAEPRRVEGTDGSGTVRVVLGPDGLPDSIRVDPGWRRAVGSEGFADAVVEACTRAANAQLAARVEEAGSDPAPVSGVPPPAAADGPVRDLGEMTRELLAMLDNRVWAAGEANGTGTTAFGKLEITLSHTGLQSFVADPGWVSRQTDEDLMDALASALSSARADLGVRADQGRESNYGR
jgi:DNA-binding protein YbaB